MNDSKLFLLVRDYLLSGYSVEPDEAEHAEATSMAQQYVDGFIDRPEIKALSDWLEIEDNLAKGSKYIYHYFYATYIEAQSMPDDVWDAVPEGQRLAIELIVDHYLASF